MSKQELALCAGISTKTLNRWLRPFRDELAALGLRPQMKVLPPVVVKWICERFAIDA